MCARACAPGPARGIATVITRWKWDNNRDEPREPEKKVTSHRDVTGIRADILIRAIFFGCWRRKPVWWSLWALAPDSKPKSRSFVLSSPLFRKWKKISQVEGSSSSCVDFDKSITQLSGFRRYLVRVCVCAWWCIDMSEHFGGLRYRKHQLPVSSTI